MGESRLDAGVRPLDDDERAYVAAARAKAHVLYEGEQVAHHSCGIALAVTFGRATPPYQVLRRGGITGEEACGAFRAGALVLGELLGDPDPTGPVTDALRAAISWYQRAAAAIDRGGAPDVVCNNLVRRFGDFSSEARKVFCNSIAAEVAALTAEALCRFGAARPEITPVGAS